MFKKIIFRNLVEKKLGDAKDMCHHDVIEMSFITFFGKKLLWSEFLLKQDSN